MWLSKEEIELANGFGDREAIADFDKGQVQWTQEDKAWLVWVQQRGEKAEVTK